MKHRLSSCLCINSCCPMMYIDDKNLMVTLQDDDGNEVKVTLEQFLNMSDGIFRMPLKLNLGTNQDGTENVANLKITVGELITLFLRSLDVQVVKEFAQQHFQKKQIDLPESQTEELPSSSNDDGDGSTRTH